MTAIFHHLALSKWHPRGERFAEIQGARLCSCLHGYSRIVVAPGCTACDRDWVGSVRLAFFGSKCRDVDFVPIPGCHQQHCGQVDGLVTVQLQSHCLEVRYLSRRGLDGIYAAAPHVWVNCHACYCTPRHGSSPHCSCRFHATHSTRHFLVQMSSAYQIRWAIIRTCSQIPLADGRWKLAFHRGFHAPADRIQNHLFSLTADGTMTFGAFRSVTQQGKEFRARVHKDEARVN